MGKNKCDSNLRRKAGCNRIFKKKYFRGNQFSLASTVSINLTSKLEITNSTQSNILTSTSSKKLSHSSKNSNAKNNDSNKLPSCFILIDTDILKSIVTLIGHCPQCHNNSIEISTDLSKKKGLAVFLNISCTTSLCDWKQSFYSSKEIEKQGPGMSSFEINYRSVVAIREIGKGHSGLEKFCGLMNLPPPMNIKAFNDIQDKIHMIYQSVADVKMKNSANEFRYLNNNIQPNDFDINVLADVVVSCDGTWQKRGYSSLNGVVTVIASDSGKCVDYRVLSKICNACTSWESRT